VNVDCGQCVGRDLKNIPVVMRLREGVPRHWRLTGGRHRSQRRLDGFADVLPDLPDRFGVDAEK